MKTTALMEILNGGYVELPYPEINALCERRYRMARAELDALVALVDEQRENLAWQVFLVDYFRQQLRELVVKAHVAMEIQPARERWQKLRSSSTAIESDDDATT